MYLIQKVSDFLAFKKKQKNMQHVKINTDLLRTEVVWI